MQQLAFRLAEHTGVNIFLTGKAGTGKTTFLRRLVETSSKRIVVAAPTGIAAINARGTTLHSLLQLPFGPYVPGSVTEPRRYSKRKLALLRSMDMLVIDEISMVRADLLDLVDDTLRRVRNPRLPFGGVQLLLIGDLQQLPPVVRDDEWALLRDTYPSPFFFHSRALARAGYVTIELEHVYRQDDEHFLHLLNNVRDGRDLAATLADLNSRYIPGFVPDDHYPWIRLTTHNATAAAINDQRLAQLPGAPTAYACAVTGNVPESAYPADAVLNLKVGAQVMFIKNDNDSHRYFNGMIGRVEALDNQSVTVAVPGVDQKITVGPVEWQNTRYDIDPATKEMTEIVEGTFAQIPLRTAWAITIHKSQGLTFSHACIDASAAFAHGQAYVALSRCKNLQGLVLTSPLSIDSIITDRSVADFIESGRSTRPDGAQVARFEQDYVATLLDNLFLLESLRHYFEAYRRVVADAFANIFPSLVSRYDLAARQLDELANVGRNFSARYRATIAADNCPVEQSAVQQRIAAGARYFADALSPIVELTLGTPSEHDNKETSKRLDRTRQPFARLLTLTNRMLRYLTQNPFVTADYLRARAHAIVEIDTPDSDSPKKRSPRRTSRPKAVAKQAPHTLDTTNPVRPLPGNDITNPGLYAALVDWRRATARNEQIPAFRVLSNKALVDIANTAPANHYELLTCHGIGPATANKYGPAILSLIAAHPRS